MIRFIHHDFNSITDSGVKGQYYFTESGSGETVPIYINGTSGKDKFKTIAKNALKGAGAGLAAGSALAGSNLLIDRYSGNNGVKTLITKDSMKTKIPVVIGTTVIGSVMGAGKGIHKAYKDSKILKSVMNHPDSYKLDHQN